MTPYRGPGSAASPAQTGGRVTFFRARFPGIFFCGIAAGMKRVVILTVFVGLAGAVLIAGKGYRAPPPLSAIPGEAAVGIRTLQVDGGPMRFEAGELLCYQGAAGFRAPAGMIVALNERGEVLARTEPTNRAWTRMSAGLAPGADAGEIARMRERAERLC